MRKYEPKETKDFIAEAIYLRLRLSQIGHICSEPGQNEIANIAIAREFLDMYNKGYDDALIDRGILKNG